MDGEAIRPTGAIRIALHEAGVVRHSGVLGVGVVRLHVHGNLGFAHDGLGDILAHSFVVDDDLFTILNEGLLDGKCVGNLNASGHLIVFQALELRYFRHFVGWCGT
jgi:hypothetical protein